MGKQWKQWQTLFSWAPKSLWMVTAAMKLKDACFLEAKLSLIRQHIKKQRHCFADKDPYSQSYGFPVVMSRCENWTIKKTECQRTDVFQLWCWRRLLKVPWTARKSNQVNPKGNQSWIFTGRTDAEAETPILWPPHAKSWLTGKDSDAWRNWGQEKGMTEDDMAGWHHRLDGHEFE